ncbi:MAG: DUF4124 domain-containing protein [Burkholderiaceae bacterium]
MYPDNLKWWVFAVALIGLEQVAAQGIYSCTDGKGKRITSDRPIAECIDREQKELNKSGTVRRSVGPTLTAVERAQLEEIYKQEAEERTRQIEERRRNRSLLVRYPNKVAHDKERELALEQVDRVSLGAKKRIEELGKQSKALAVEADFYTSSKTKISPVLAKKIEQNEQDLEAQRVFIASQSEEKIRVNQRFDEELARLNVMWAEQAGTGKDTATKASKPQ